MAKIIRQIKKKKRSKLAEEDINKNSGKEISHTISKIKAHERFYTFILVIIFMITISLSVFLGLRVDSFKIYDASYYASNYSLNGELITLNQNDIMSDADGLLSFEHTVNYTNHTDHNINYIIRFAEDEESFERCKCSDKKIDYHAIKYSIDGKTVHQFSEETMIITAGMVSVHNTGEMHIRLWIDEKYNKNSECFFYGKFILEELENMDQ